MDRHSTLFCVDTSDSRIKLLKKMKKLYTILFVSLLLVSCHQKIQQKDISKLNGYWEIEKVVFEKGDDKDYIVNESYDYFQIDKNNAGFRKKVMPQLDGTFLVNDTQEDLKIRFDDEKVFLDYTTPYAKWSEEMIEISNDKLVFKNAENKEYHYKKAAPINLENDGKKTK
jgi:hypothetical protein